MSMSRDDVLRIVDEARERGDRPNLKYADLRGANLRDAYMGDADLRGADLRSANLEGVYLWDANLWGADLHGANLSNANLRVANLGRTDLRDANLSNAILWDTNLSGVLWAGIQITDLPSGQLTLIPTCDGWRLTVGCWSGTPDQLRDLIAQDEDWPEAEGDEITRRRPYLAAALALCEVHMKDHADVIDDLKEKWGE